MIPIESRLNETTRAIQKLQEVFTELDEKLILLRQTTTQAYLLKKTGGPSGSSFSKF